MLPPVTDTTGSPAVWAATMALMQMNAQRIATFLIIGMIVSAFESGAILAPTPRQQCKPRFTHRAGTPEPAGAVKLVQAATRGENNMKAMRYLSLALAAAFLLTALPDHFDR